jgi:Ca2+-binding RTX toxin-like protein
VAILINGTPDTDIIILQSDTRGSFEIWGGGGGDVLFGGPFGDLIIGGEGRDTLAGWHGDDTLYGGTEDDWLHGERGDDTLVGGDGNDGMRGGSGNDRMYGDDGYDHLNGDWGHDTMTGGAGVDTFYFTENAVDIIVYQGGPFRWECLTFETDVITDFDTSGADSDKLDIEEILKYYSNYVDRSDPANTAADAIARGYVYWIESGAAATLKTTVYVDLDAGTHHPGPPSFGQQADLALVDLAGVSAAQVNAGDFIV